MKNLLTCILCLTLASLCLSQNSGQIKWQQTSGPSNVIVKALAVSGLNLFAGTDGSGVFLSTNNGANWNAVNAGLTNTSVYTLAISGTNLFAGTYGGVFLSTNNGSSWSMVNTGLTNMYVSALTISGTNLFAGTYDVGVFLSTNNGSSWSAVNTGLTNTNIRSITASGTNLFVGTYSSDGGVFLSANNGANWKSVNDGLTYTTVYALTVSGTNIFAGTYGGGVFISALPAANAAPAAPQNLTATAGNAQVTVKWNKNTEADFLRYRIYRSTSPNPTTKVDSTLGGITDTVKIFSGLTNGTAYYFCVTAVDSSGLESGYSNEVSATPIGHPLTITSFTPTRNALNVPANTKITIAFNADINTSTVTNSTIRVNGSLSGLHPCTFSYNQTAHTVTGTPNVQFKVGETVITTVTRGVMNATGDSLSSSYSWMFTVKTNVCTGLFDQRSTVGVGYTPWYLAAADFNGDSAIDLAVANNSSNDVSILTNNGKGIFTKTSTMNVGNSPASITTADLDGDGDMDLVVTNCGGNTVSIIKNNGQGSFTQTSTVIVQDNPWNVTAADLDGNGTIDLAVTSYSGTVSILKNNGSGSFTLASTVTVGSIAYSVTAADVNNDGAIDLVVANYGSNTISILTNNGRGIFTQSQVLNVGNAPVAIAATDMDGDGAIDLAVANLNSNTISILKNNGNGMFTLTSTVNTGINPTSVIAVDPDGNGIADLAVANQTASTVSIFKNDGSGSFTQTSAVSTGAGSAPRIVIAADLDGDGYIDLATANLSLNCVSILLNRSMNAPAPPQNLIAAAANAQVTLQWNKNTEADFLRYRMYRSTSPNPTIKVDSTTGGISDTIKVYNGLTNGTTYYFRVTAVDSSGSESGYSNEVIAIPALSPCRYVNVVNGNDTVGNGTEGRPFRSISKAISIASDGDSIVIAAGTYSTETTGAVAENTLAVTGTQSLMFVAGVYNGSNVVTITHGFTMNSSDTVSLGETGMQFNLGTTATALQIIRGTLKIATANVIIGSGGRLTINNTAKLNAPPTNTTDLNVYYTGGGSLSTTNHFPAVLGGGTLNINRTSDTITVTQAISTTGAITLAGTGVVVFSNDVTAGGNVTCTGTVSFKSTLTFNGVTGQTMTLPSTGITVPNMIVTLQDTTPSPVLNVTGGKLTVSNTLTMNNGDISADTTLQLGTSSTIGILQRYTGMIYNGMSRTVDCNTSIPWMFPIGVRSIYRPITLMHTTATGSALRIVRVSYINSAPVGTVGLPIVDGTTTINALSPFYWDIGYWDATDAHLLVPATFPEIIFGLGGTIYYDISKVRSIYRIPDPLNAWKVAPTTYIPTDFVADFPGLLYFFSQGAVTAWASEPRLIEGFGYQATTSSVSGMVAYANTAATPIGSVTVTLTPASATGTIITTTTSPTGTYSFANVSAGTYTLGATKTGHWGGVTGSDALIVARHAAGITGATLTGLPLLAADVNKSGSVTAGDALLIVRRAVGSDTLFTAGDWVFSSQTVTVASEPVTVNVTGLAMGDVNASYTPSAGTAFAKAVSLSNDAIQEVSSVGTFEVPVRMTSEMILGAASLKINYPAEVVTFAGISSKLHDVVIRTDEGSVTIVWADISAKNAMAFKANEALVTLKFSPKASKAIVGITADSWSELSNADGTVISMAKLSAPIVEITNIPTVFSLSQNYPNPFNPSTSLRYGLPSRSSVRLVIYNMLGQVVKDLVNTEQPAGYQSVIWNANVSSGMYFYRLEATSINDPSKQFVETKKMLLLR